MPEIKTYIIIGLVILSIYQYSFPEDSQMRLEPILGTIKDSITGIDINPFDNENETSICPSIINQVCGSDGKTYDNICFAVEADILETTPGEC